MESSASEFEVLIAGGGVAGLEAVLALRETGLESLAISLLSPVDEFVLAPLSVAEPFGAGDAPRVGLADFCAEHGVELIAAGLSEVWPDQRRVLTDDGAELFYDALLLCTGARRRPVLADAITFSGGAESEAVRQLVADATAAGSGRIAFVVPREVNWPLPLYELALGVADRLRDTEVEVTFTTAEYAPLSMFGDAASTRLAEILADAGIELRAGEAEPAGERGDWLVTVPRLEVPDIPGVPQVTHGFVPVDATMRVQSVDRVWAVGDVTWSPIKQGGLAAQQADTAAADIAREAGADVPVPPYVPVLRAALLTADGPFYLRSGTDEDGGQRAPLWWPPAKVAGRLLAPYLARRIDPTITEQPLVDRATDPDRDAEHEEGLQLALRWADVDAAEGEYRRALHWIDVAESLNLVVPDRYRQKRREWERRLGGAEDPGTD